jgi:hypothetical protein
MIWSTSYHRVTVLVHQSWPHLLFTIALVHRRQVITQLALHTCNRSVERSLILIFSTLVAWLHVISHMQWAPSSHYHLWTNLLCISLKHILVHLGCHSITKTKLGTFQDHNAFISTNKVPSVIVWKMLFTSEVKLHLCHIPAILHPLLGMNWLTNPQSVGLFSFSLATSPL